MWLVGHRPYQGFSYHQGQWPCPGTTIMRHRRARHFRMTFRERAENVAKTLTQGERSWLIEHANGPRPIIIGIRKITREKAERLRIIEKARTPKPKFTFLTDFGREVLIVLLQREIDQLVSDGCLDPDAQPLTTAPERPVAHENKPQSVDV